MLRYLILTLLFIFLVRFIMRFVLPMVRITSAVRGQMKNMQGQHNQSQPVPQPNQKVKEGDYIDYEEVK